MSIKKIILFIILIFGNLFANTEITVYNNNLGLIKEERKIVLKKGIQNYIYKDVTATIIPESVILKFKEKEKPQVLEQNFEYDLVDSYKILFKYIDKKISIYTKQNKNYTGILLSYDSNGIVLKTKRGIIIITKQNIMSIKFSELPEGLITRPALKWKLESPLNKKYNIQINYLTRGINWKADYIAKLNKKDNEIDLQAWITLNNNTGLSFHNSTLLLIAGDVNLVLENRFKREFKSMTKKGTVYKAAQPTVKEEKFFEYHLYRIPYKINIKDNQQKQIKFITAYNVKCKKEFIYDGGKNVKTYIKFKNNKKNNLGIPLPAGKIRMYKNDSKGSLQFIGENLIKHTPEGEEIELFTGNAFDIIGEKKRLKYRKYGEKEYGYKYKITIKNRKDEKITVIVREYLYGDWEIINSTLPYKKEDASTVIWKIKVPSKNKKELIYEYRYTY